MFAVFSLGALAATISLGAVQYVAASGGTTITACANKSTGAMRLLSKGSCKKTERKATWNQQGIQGLTGPAGAKGDTGARGDQGLAINGMNGQNLYAIDDANQNLGVVTQASADQVTVLAAGGLWSWDTDKYSSGNGTYWFRNSSCTIPLGIVGLYLTPFTSSFKVSPQTRFVVQKSVSQTPTAAYAVTGQPFNIQTLTTVYEWSFGNQSCGSRTVSSYFTGENWAVYDLVEVPLPAYTPPIQIVQR
jgi:hypothetical protein